MHTLEHLSTHALLHFFIQPRLFPPSPSAAPVFLFHIRAMDLPQQLKTAPLDKDADVDIHDDKYFFLWQVLSLASRTHVHTKHTHTHTHTHEAHTQTYIYEFTSPSLSYKEEQEKGRKMICCP